MDIRKISNIYKKDEEYTKVTTLLNKLGAKKIYPSDMDKNDVILYVEVMKYFKVVILNKKRYMILNTNAPTSLFKNLSKLDNVDLMSLDRYSW